MQRRFQSVSIDLLIDLFNKSKADPQVLKHLEHELQFRRVPRAVALLADVEAALRALSTSQPGATAASSVAGAAQGDLWTDPPGPTSEAPTRTLPESSASSPGSPGLAAQDETAPPPAVVPAQRVGAASQTLGGVSPSQKPSLSVPRASTPTAAPTMPLDEACGLLKVSATAPWLTVEQARRQAVLLAHPDLLEVQGTAQRERSLAHARRINEACLVLIHVRLVQT